MEKLSLVRDKTNHDSEDPYEEENSGPCYLAWGKFTRGQEKGMGPLECP